MRAGMTDFHSKNEEDYCKRFGLIDGEEASVEAAESKKDEAVQADSVNEEVTLDLGDELEIEIEE